MLKSARCSSAEHAGYQRFAARRARTGCSLGASRFQSRSGYGQGC
jgi:hypothetical protein